MNDCFLSYLTLKIIKAAFGNCIFLHEHCNATAENILKRKSGNCLTREMPKQMFRQERH